MGVCVYKSMERDISPHFDVCILNGGKHKDKSIYMYIYWNSPDKHRDTCLNRYIGIHGDIATLRFLDAEYIHMVIAVPIATDRDACIHVWINGCVSTNQ